MDLQSVKAHYGAHWAWARTGALILFLVTALLLAVSLTGVGSSTTAQSPLQAGTSISSLFVSGSAG
jgi:hypothetical protein